MNPALLEAMVAVVDYGTFTAAADVLHITQPSLSKRIRALEREVGAQLFVPAGRRMALTDVGREMLAPARRILRETAALRVLGRAERDLEHGLLRVGGQPSLLSTCVPYYVARLHRRFPNLRIEVVGLESGRELMDAVRLARVDVAFGVAVRAPEDVQLEQLGRQEFLVVLPPAAGEETALDQVVDAETLTAHTLVTLPRGTSIRAMTDAAYESFGVRPPGLLVTTQRDALVLLAVHGAGLTVVPRTLAELGQRMGARVARFPTPITRPVSIAYRRSERRSTALASFLDLVHSSAPAGGLAPA